MKKIIVLITACFVTLLSACKKDLTTPTAGIYRGSFARVVDVDDTNARGTVAFALLEEQKGFVCQVVGGSDYPVSCNGIYSLIPGNQIAFFKASNIYYPEEDRFLVLDTTYVYSFNEPNFNLQLMTEDSVQYFYTLKRD